MTPAELRAVIDAQAAADPEFAALVAARNDSGLAAALPRRMVPRSYPITKRGVRAVLGKSAGRSFILALREAAAMVASLPEAATGYDDLWWLAELLPDLEAGGAGVDIALPETRAALRGLAALGPQLGTTHVVTLAHCEALEAASSDEMAIGVDDVSRALNEVA